MYTWNINHVESVTTTTITTATITTVVSYAVKFPLKISLGTNGFENLKLKEFKIEIIDLGSLKLNLKWGILYGVPTLFKGSFQYIY
jgi:hypothetical protein